MRCVSFPTSCGWDHDRSILRARFSFLCPSQNQSADAPATCRYHVKRGGYGSDRGKTLERHWGESIRLDLYDRSDECYRAARPLRRRPSLLTFHISWLRVLQPTALFSPADGCDESFVCILRSFSMVVFDTTILYLNSLLFLIWWVSFISLSVSCV